VQALPSLQVVPSGLAGFEQAPVAGSQVPAAWHWSDAAQTTLVPLQTPRLQVSFCVQVLPSLHGVPMGLTGWVQVPVLGWQTPALWQSSAATQTTGLVPTHAAIRGKKQIALANKEPMVMAGQLMQEEARRAGVRIFPVDSEHSAIFQSLEGHRIKDVRRLILTASGGALWNLPKEALSDVTPERALQHPNWKMGAKITIDSATLMNKGLEVVEARWLFDIPESRIDVLIHRESIIHSLVEYEDRSIISQLGLPDMRTPISYAMRYPDRLPLDLPSLDLTEIGTLTFCKPDHDRFPCLRLGYESLRIGGTMPAAMNAANEIAVDAFLNGGIRFTDISDIIQSTMQAHTPQPVLSVEAALEADRWAREKADSLVHTLAR